MKKNLLPLAIPLALSLGCASGFSLPWQAEEEIESVDAKAVPEIYIRAVADRGDFYEREVERLRADLRQAEESIVALESGLRDPRSRANAVSAIAEVRVALDRVRPSVPWRHDQIVEAEKKLSEADHQLQEGHIGAAVFFASRAKRVSESLRAEVVQVALWKKRRQVSAQRANLRSGPSQKHDVVEVLPHATPVLPERSHQGWTLVRTPDGRIGWVHASLLENSTASPAKIR